MIFLLLVSPSCTCSVLHFKFLPSIMAHAPLSSVNPAYLLKKVIGFCLQSSFLIVWLPCVFLQLNYIVCAMFCHCSLSFWTFSFIVLWICDYFAHRLPSPCRVSSKVAENTSAILIALHRGGLERAVSVYLLNRYIRLVETLCDHSCWLCWNLQPWKAQNLFSGGGTRLTYKGVSNFSPWVWAPMR